MPGITESKYTLAGVRVAVKDTHNGLFPNPNAVLMYSMTITLKKDLLHFLCKGNCKNRIIADTYKSAK